MPDRTRSRSNYRSDLEPRPTELVAEHGRRPPRLELTREERRRLPVDFLVALTPLRHRDPATWTPEEEAAVSAALARANGDETVVAVRTRFAELSPSARTRRDTWREVVNEYNEVNRDLVSMRRQSSDTSSRRLARNWVDGLKRDRGVAAREAEREAWRANPENPQAVQAIRLAQERAEQEVERQRPTLEAEAYREFNFDRRRDRDARFNRLSSRKGELRQALQSAGVPVPDDPRELTTS